jgi:hypothetical protein
MSIPLLLVVLLVVFAIFGTNSWVPPERQPRALTVLLVIVLVVWLLGGFGGWWGHGARWCP